MADHTDKTLQHLPALEATLQQMVEAHETLLTLLHRKRDALRRNDVDALSQVGALEKEKIARIADLEKHRLELAAHLTLQIDPQAKQPMRLGELAERLPEPARGRLLVLRCQLRDRMQHVRDAASVVRRASETLLTHVQGLVQSVVMMANGTTTYSRTATPPQHQTAVRTINLTA
ncbi:MAG: flagellar protein FlgN [Phycisphaeraceae bacterium]